jgi:hypothetical protein
MLVLESFWQNTKWSENSGHGTVPVLVCWAKGEEETGDRSLWFIIYGRRGSSCEETETKQGHTATTVQCGAREGGREGGDFIGDREEREQRSDKQQQLMQSKASNNLGGHQTARLLLCGSELSQIPVSESSHGLAWLWVYLGRGGRGKERVLLQRTENKRAEDSRETQKSKKQQGELSCRNSSKRSDSSRSKQRNMKRRRKRGNMSVKEEREREAIGCGWVQN